MGARWTIGVLIGTALVAVTSPLFVRSYLPRVQDPRRGVPVLQPGSDYRWRSEGYATTRIGPLGMPGQPSPPRDDDGGIQLALWGDSQAEGVCVEDPQKVAAQVAELSADQIRVFPFARSGDDCNDWISQILALGEEANDGIPVDAHVFLVVQWSDWCVAIDDTSEEIDPTLSKISATLPAFLIQAARNTITSGDGTKRRQLRFRLGPVKRPRDVNLSEPAVAETVKFTAMAQRLSRQLARLHRHCDRPCIFLYAPLVPAIIEGEIRVEDPDDFLFERFLGLCADHGFLVLDLRSAMKSATRAGDWPTGFHNGQFGVGHYNARGNQIIAEHLSKIPGLIAATSDDAPPDFAQD